MRQLQDTAELHDYTELVIELWTAYMGYGFNLSSIGGGDSRDGIDVIQRYAMQFIDIVEDKEAQGWWWDGGWIDAVQAWAHNRAKTLKYGHVSDSEVFNITKYMEPKEI